MQRKKPALPEIQPGIVLGNGLVSRGFIVLNVYDDETPGEQSTEAFGIMLVDELSVVEHESWLHRLHQLMAAHPDALKMLLPLPILLDAADMLPDTDESRALVASAKETQRKRVEKSIGERIKIVGGLKGVDRG